MTGSLQTGSIVDVRGERWLLTRVQPFASCTVLSLEGRDRDNAMQQMQLIAPFDQPRAVTSRRLQQRRRTVVINHAVAAIRRTAPVAGLWTAADAHIDLHAYQLEPALAAVGGATRLLLADAVGLGKTIQAGLLLSELRQRGWIARALILCPAGLRETWRRELQERFGIAATIIDQQSIADRIAAFPPGINPWMVDGVTIVSIDFIKRDEVMAALDGVPVDLLIADEAHHLSAGTDRGMAAARLAARSTWCVLVSATPHSGEPDAFADLTRLGRHVEPIRIFRRHRRDVGLPDARRIHFLNVRLDADEHALLDGIARYSRAIWMARGRVDSAARLVAITLARRACSSIAAIGRTLKRRRDLLGSDPGGEAQPRLPWEDLDDADDQGDAIVAAPGFESLDDERAALDALITLVAACSAQSKMHRLQRLLARIAEPVIVFTEYRDTLDAIARALDGAYRVTAIHGAMPRDARTGAVDRFNQGAFDVLVATDAAGEGLNLHHRCRLVIDFELPWNPLRLEQRLGRVDRIGQQRVVHAIRLFHGGTIEQDVLDRLALRRRRADDDLDRAVSEREVAAAIFDGSHLDVTEATLARTPVLAAAAAEVNRLLAQRRTTRSNAPERCWAAPKRSSTRRLICVLREIFINAHAVVSGDRVHAVAVTLDRSPGCRREWRAAIDGIAEWLPPSGLTGDVDQRRRILRRIDSIRRLLARGQRREYQRSLFDGRVEEAQSARERDGARLDAALARIERAVSPADPARTRVEVVAAFPERRA